MTDPFLTAAEVAALLPTYGGRRRSAETVRRWAHVGVLVAGRTVKLPCEWLPRGRAFRRSHVDQFLAALTAARAAAARTPEEILADAGVLPKPQPQEGGHGKSRRRRA